MNLIKIIKGSACELKSTKTLVISALMVALYVVLSYFSTFVTNTLRVSFTYIPVVMTAALFGPVCAGFVGALGDVCAYLTTQFAGGSFFPGFTLDAFIAGFIYGIFLYKSDFSLIRVLLAKIFVVLIIQLGLTPIWLSMMYGKSFFVLVSGRIVKNLIFIPIDTIVILLVVKRAYKYIESVYIKGEKAERNG